MLICAGLEILSPIKLHNRSLMISCEQNVSSAPLVVSNLETDLGAVYYASCLEAKL